MSRLLLPYSRRIRALERRVRATAPTSWWPLDDAAASAQARDLSGNSQRADYAGSGVTYRAAMGHGRSGVTLSGTDTYVNIMTTANTFDSTWNGDRYSVAMWGRVDGASRWTDAASYRYLAHFRATDATYYTVMGKSQTDHQLAWRRRTGGAITELTYTFSPTGPLDEFCMGMTFDVTGPLFIAYLWDSVTGFREVARSTSASLVSWVGNAPVEGTSVLGAGSLTLQEWFGSLRDAMVWSGTALSAAQMRAVMTP